MKVSLSPFYELPKPAKTFFWVMLCLINILIVFAACYTSAKSVQGYTLAVTGFVLVLLTYSHEKRRRNALSWVLISYAFYSILVSGYTFYQSIVDRARYKEMGSNYTVFLYAGSNIPYIFCAVSILTTAIWGFFIYRTKRPVNRLLKVVFAANLIIFLLTQFI